ncbi:hypothetical protein RND71_014501 [Anisodus tanguticus]|uniref:Uncharacterized protein n=1 Tax=Anisodus tanguticus TaxID=243964 RepID=A0AAE1SCX3_9SOLA|nr:hypothetical protein RND71_014501 [Anisodus tanguticus]
MAINLSISGSRKILRRETCPDQSIVSFPFKNVMNLPLLVPHNSDWSKSSQCLYINLEKAYGCDDFLASKNLQELLRRRMIKILQLLLWFTIAMFSSTYEPRGDLIGVELKTFLMWNGVRS